MQTNEDEPPDRVYTLGATAGEQERLLTQRNIYGDTQGIRFADNAEVCELGCGPGSNLWIADQCRNGLYFGIDIQPEQVRAAEALARTSALTNAAFLVGSATATGLKDEQFDAVFIRCLLVHLPDPASALREARRILRTGGQLVLLEPDDESLDTGPGKPALQKCWQARTRHLIESRGTTPALGQKLERLLSSTGFSKIRTEPHTVSYSAEQPEQCRLLMTNWLGIIERVSADLIAAGLINADDLKTARQEAATVAADTCCRMTIHRAFAEK